MSVAPQSQSGGDAGRVRCLYCGANNFPASIACWQCSRPLQAMHSAPAETSSASGLPPGTAPISGAAPILGAALRPALTESPLAPKAAAALGLLFPYVGLPAGILFLMLDDPRKTQLGWLLIGWSLAGSVASLLSLAVTLGPLWALLRGMLPHAGGSAPASPGLPDMGGDGAGIFLRLLFCGG